jgi:hypothetical protein
VRHVTDRSQKRSYVRSMVSLVMVVVGFVALLVARVVSPADPITRRAYGKLYSGAPGANTESKPDAR